MRGTRWSVLACLTSKGLYVHVMEGAADGLAFDEFIAIDYIYIIIDGRVLREVSGQELAGDEVARGASVNNPVSPAPRLPARQHIIIFPLQREDDLAL